MRQSPLRHTLAVLRKTIGPEMTQKELARLANRSVVTIQKIELCRPGHTLSEGLAHEIAARVGVSFDWLMRNNVKVRPVDKFGDPYTRETFERTMAADPDVGQVFNNSVDSLNMIGRCLIMIARATLVANEQNNVELLSYRLENSIQQITDGFKGHKEFLSKWYDRWDVAQAHVTDGGTDKVIYNLIAEFAEQLGKICDAQYHKANKEERRIYYLKTRPRPEK